MPPAKRTLPDLSVGLNPLPAIESKVLSRLPCIMAAIGHTGSGKTYLSLGIIKRLLDEKTVNFIFLISPTASSNTLYKSVCTPENSMLFEDISAPNVYKSIAFIEMFIEGRAEAYRQQLEYAVAHKKFTSGKPITQADEWMLESMGFRNPRIERPSFLLLVDDCASSPLLAPHRTNTFNSFCLRSRHIGGGLGCSVIMVAQSFRGHIPRALRLNLTHCAIFKTHSKIELQAIFQEVASMVTEQQFLAKYDECTREKHDYLWIDFIRGQLRNSY